MWRRCLILAAVLAGLLVLVNAQTLEEVLEKNLKARGGKDKILSVQSARITGKMQMGPGMEAPITFIWKRPAKMRMEFTFQGMTGIQAYDGKEGWAVMPFQGKTEPEKMSAEDMKRIDEQTDYDGPLVDYQAKGHKVELLGKETMEGTEVFKLKLTKKNGDISTLYLDAESGLEIKETGKRIVQGQEMDFENTTSDYKEVDGMMVAHSMQSKMSGIPVPQTFLFTKIEYNVPLDDQLFVIPAPKTEAKPEEKK